MFSVTNEAKTSARGMDMEIDWITRLNLRNGEKDQIPYYNTLLGALYPGLKIGILQVDRDPARETVMEKLLVQEYDGCRLDGSTGSIKKGQVLMTDNEIARRYFASPEAAYAYERLLLTNCCEPVQQIPMKVAVVEDGEWQTGDCHAKLDARFAESMLADGGRALQFRLACDKFLAKGVAVVDTPAPVGEPALPADLIVPLSSFKSAEKPAPGLYDWQVTWGTVRRSNKRMARVGYQFWQWFSKEAIIQDVMPHVVERCKQLNEAGESPKAAVEVLALDATGAEFTMLNVIKADVHDQLHSHPWIVKGLTTMLRRRWLELALGGGLRADSFIGCPDESLKDGQFICNELPPGRYIAYRNPIRNWSNIRLWENVGKRTGPKDVVWMNVATAAEVDGDFDGDDYCFIAADRLPTCTSEIEGWASRKAPVTIKVKTRKNSPWGLAHKVAMDQMSDRLGLIVNTVSWAVALGRLDLADTLAPQVQIAVDRFKFDIEVDENLLTWARRFLRTKVGWLDNRKDPNAFITHPLKLNFGDKGPIALMARYVSQQWEPPETRCRPLKFYLPVFDQRPELMVEARQEYRRWASLIVEAIERDDDTVGVVLEAMGQWAAGLKDKDAWASAFWRAAHGSKSKLSTGSLPFHAFPEQVADRLKGPPQPAEVLTIVGLKYHGWADELDELPPRNIITVQQVTLKGKVRSLAMVMGKALGIVSAETPTPPGIYARNLLWNGQGSVFAT